MIDRRSTDYCLNNVSLRGRSNLTLLFLLSTDRSNVISHVVSYVTLRGRQSSDHATNYVSLTSRKVRIMLWAIFHSQASSILKSRLIAKRRNCGIVVSINGEILEKSWRMMFVSKKQGGSVW